MTQHCSRAWQAARQTLPGAEAGKLGRAGSYLKIQLFMMLAHELKTVWREFKWRNDGAVVVHICRAVGLSLIQNT